LLFSETSGFSVPGTGGVYLRSAKTKDIPMEIVKALGLLRWVWDCARPNFSA